MNKKYNSPEYEIEKFTINDVITQSTGENPGGGTGDNGEIIDPFGDGQNSIGGSEF
ncbi:MAG: hypothetical protein IJT65_04795 [Eubacterium sp.]|nr:hypothetical protein [Eubacterium sp.]